jgi:hypothetical protein
MVSNARKAWRKRKFVVGKCPLCKQAVIRCYNKYEQAWYQFDQVRPAIAHKHKIEYEEKDTEIAKKLGVARSWTVKARKK